MPGPKCCWESVVGTIQERNDLGAVADAAHAELGGRDAIGDALFHGPCNSGGVELTGLDVGEGHLSGGFGATHGAPQEGDDLGPLAVTSGIKGGGGGTGGDALFHGPQDGIDVEGTLRNVGEGIFPLGITAGAGGALPVVAQSSSLIANIAFTTFTDVGGITALGAGGAVTTAS